MQFARNIITFDTQNERKYLMESHCKMTIFMYYLILVFIWQELLVL